MMRSILWAALSVVTWSGMIACGSIDSSADCRGDADEWAAITAKPLDCQKNSDCCVMINGCAAEGQVVLSADLTAAEAAFPSCNDACKKCIPPMIRVGCVSGKCVGEKVTDTPPTSELLKSHCGTDPAPVMTPSKNTHFTCGG